MQVFLGTKERDGTTVSIHEKDRRKHMAIFGKSGVGKTTLKSPRHRTRKSA